MIYSEKTFQQCAFNPFCEEKMTAHYDKLNTIIEPSWNEDPNLDSIIRYVIAAYDPKSPIVINERDLNYRKTAAAEIAMFDLEDTELMDSIYNCEHPILFELTMRYLQRFAKSKEFAAICAVEFKFWESIRKLMKPLDDDVKDKDLLAAVQMKATVSDEIEKDIARLDKYYKQFFGDDELEKKAKRRSAPEAIADSKR